MSYGALVRTLLCGTLHINMYPLVVKRSVSKEVYALLGHLKPVRDTQFLALEGSKLII